jgi:streptogramin lyase
LALVVAATLVAVASAAGQPGAVEEFSIPVPAESISPQLGMIVRGAEGSMWFTRFTGPITQENTIMRISPEGLVTGEFSLPTEKRSPSEEVRLAGLALGENGNVWFTTHGDYTNIPSSVGYVTQAGKVLMFPMSNNVNEGHYPESIVLGSNGNMWFADGESNNFQRPYALTGSIWEITPSGTTTKFAVPGNAIVGDMARGGEGNIWFLAYEVRELGEYTGHSYIGYIAPSGQVIKFGTPEGDGTPGSIALGPEGDMWFTEPDVSKIGRITPAGEISQFTAPSVGGPIVLGPDGNMWFMSGYSTSALSRITPSGAVTTFGPISSHGALVDIAVGPDDDIWFTENASSPEYVGRFTVPFEPVNVESPAISGEAVEGQTLSVSTGSWSHEPSAFAYQWQRLRWGGWPLHRFGR